MHKNKLKMAESLKHKTRHHKTPGREHKQNTSDINHTNFFLHYSPKTIEIKRKINKWDITKLTTFALQRKPLKKYYL